MAYYTVIGKNVLIDKEITRRWFLTKEEGVRYAEEMILNSRRMGEELGPLLVVEARLLVEEEIPSIVHRLPLDGEFTA